MLGFSCHVKRGEIIWNGSLSGSFVRFSGQQCSVDLIKPAQGFCYVFILGPLGLLFVLLIRSGENKKEDQ
jgi:hypothetical protein